MSKRVAILMGSKSDLSLMEPAAQVLAELGVDSSVHVLSAHRTPEATMTFATRARDEGYRVLICGAGGAAHLAGVVAAHTTLPVIGVPLARTPLAGQDALLATVQMPRGVPVATVAVDGAYNAGMLAVQMLAIEDDALRIAFTKHREATRLKVEADNASISS